MNSIFFKVILIGILTVYCRLLLANEECRLPKGCQLQMINSIVDTFGNSKIASKLHTGMRCDVYKGYKFKLDMSQIWNDTKRCKLNVDKDNPVIEIRWYKGDRSMLEKSMDITSMFILFCQLYPNGFILNMINIKRFDLDLIDFVNFKSQVNIDGVYCLSCRIVFYLDQNKILSCVEIELMERFFRGKIASIFQITKLTIDFDMNQLEYVLIRVPTNLMLVNSEFTDTLCPLLFKNSLIRNFDIIGMIDSFYKKSILTIWNVYYDWLNSQIDYLYLKKAQNINLDSDLLNPSVFAKLKSLLIYGSVNRISEEAFTYLYYLNEISFQTVYFRKLMHTNGNEWIKAINSNRSVNMSDYNDVHNWVNYLRVIKIDCFEYMQEERMSQVFPDEDFCLYYDFPFQQLLLLVQNCYGETFDLVKRTDDFSCTFLWLSQYNELYSRLFKELNWSKDYARNLQRDANNYKENSNKCNFKSMIDRCSKSNMSIGDIWGRHDYLVLNKKLEIAVLVSTHLVSLFGLVTHIIVLITILYKKNSEFFKGFKQYSYLCANSVFSLLILLIQILAWTSECFYPFEVFCPEIRKLVFVQIYKMVFKECLVTAFRYMCNFTYVAFALNRISLIGKDHNKLVKFMSDVGIKKYLGVTLFISVGLSVVKYFKYEINYDQPETSYPISNELDLSSIFRTHISNDGFIIANSISDIFNYIVFVIVIFIVDVYMVVILRQTLNEKLKKSESLNKSEKILENMRKENEEAMNNVIRMIVLNTTLSLLFKLPVSFIPIVNVYAEFYYKSLRNQFVHPKFGEFYSFLLDSGFYDVIIHFSDFSYTFIISIQIFVYKHFDKKFRSGFERLIHGDKSKKKDANK